MTSPAGAEEQGAAEARGGSAAAPCGPAQLTERPGGNLRTTSLQRSIIETPEEGRTKQGSYKRACSAVECTIEKSIWSFADPDSLRPSKPAVLPFAPQQPMSWAGAVQQRANTLSAHHVELSMHSLGCYCTIAGSVDWEHGFFLCLDAILDWLQRDATRERLACCVCMCAKFDDALGRRFNLQ